MKRVLLVLAFASSVYAQNWSGILTAVPSNGTANCVGCAVDWTTAGVVGGIPSGSWTQSGSTITSTGSDQTSQIQTALNACGTNHFVKLAAGTFVLTGNLSIPSNCVLRGSGASSTIISNQYTGGNAFLAIGDFSTFGSLGFPTAGISITAGNTAGSTTISASSTSGLTVGTQLIITGVNDGTIVDSNGTEGNCNYCDQGQTSDGSRAQGQLSRLISCDSGNTTVGHVCASAANLGISPGLLIQYATPTEVPYAPVASNAGIENLQVYSTSSSNATPNFQMTAAYNAWLSGVESNYTGANHVDLFFCLHCAVVDSYFTNTFGSGSGSYDHGIRLANKTTLSLVQNNIFERTGVIEMEWGDAANVFAYNFKTGAYDGGPLDQYFPADIESHGAHSQFDLFEGNIVPKVQMDSIHGSTSNDTFFRDWIKGANISCNPTDGSRGTVVCTPMGVRGAGGVNGWWDVQSVIANSIDFLSTYQNFVGQVVGSTDMNALAHGNTSPVLTHVNQISYTTTRDYDSAAYGYTFGFGNTADDGSGGLTNGAGCTTGGLSYPCHSAAPLSTSFQHGIYSMFDGSVVWHTGTTHTLPSSFYLSAQPSWWVFPSGTTSPWPGIGPDVTGGVSQASGLAYLNPAANCFLNVMGGVIGGAGGPKTFEPSACYVGTSTSKPGAPTGLIGVVH